MRTSWVITKGLSDMSTIWWGSLGGTFRQRLAIPETRVAGVRWVVINSHKTPLEVATLCRLINFSFVLTPSCLLHPVVHWPGCQEDKSCEWGGLWQALYGGRPRRWQQIRVQTKWGQCQSLWQLMEYYSWLYMWLQLHCWGCCC